MLAAMDILLQSYSEKTIAAVCGPKGICTKLEYFPSIAKLKTALDDEAANQAKGDVYAQLVQKTLQEREEHYGPKDKGKYPTLESMKATYPDFMKEKPKFDPVKEKSAFMAKHNLSEEAFNAIPNAEDYNWQTMLSKPAKPLPGPDPKQPEEPNPFE